MWFDGAIGSQASGLDVKDVEEGGEGSALVVVVVWW
jgi:hypothetical protein